jgi:hypothetical protein
MLGQRVPIRGIETLSNAGEELLAPRRVLLRVPGAQRRRILQHEGAH